MKKPMSPKPDREAIDLMVKTIYCVEANHFEDLTLWQRWSLEAFQMGERRFIENDGVSSGRLTWEQIPRGWFYTVGKVAKRPIIIALSWYKIDGYHVLFYSGASELVDYALIRKWLQTWCRPRLNGRDAFTDAMNFCHVIQTVRELKEKGVAP